MWGAGENGRVFLNFLQNHNLYVTEVVDKDVNKHGNIINGYLIKEPEEVIGNIQVVMVCTFSFYTEVMMELQGKDFDVIDIENNIERV